MGFFCMSSLYIYVAGLTKWVGYLGFCLTGPDSCYVLDICVLMFLYCTSYRLFSRGVYQPVVRWGVLLFTGFYGFSRWSPCVGRFCNLGWETGVLYAW